MHRPVSKLVAPGIGLAAILQLFFTPLPNGDGFLPRLMSIFSSVSQGQTAPNNLLAADNAGNNVFSILGIQLMQNALPAALTGLGAALTYKFGRWLGM